MPPPLGSAGNPSPGQNRVSAEDLEAVTSILKQQWAEAPATTPGVKPMAIMGGGGGGGSAVGMAEMKAEMKADVSAVRSELGGKMDSLNAQMSRLQATLDALMAASGQSVPLSVAVPPA